jgi:hypothetical protein
LPRTAVERPAGRRRPRPFAALADAGLQRALEDPEPLRGFAQFVARLAAAFVVPGYASGLERGDSTQRAPR